MNKQTNQTFISQFVTGFEFKKKKKIMKYSFLMLKLLYISTQKKKKLLYI